MVAYVVVKPVLVGHIAAKDGSQRVHVALELDFALKDSFTDRLAPAQLVDAVIEITILELLEIHEEQMFARRIELATNSSTFVRAVKRRISQAAPLRRLDPLDDHNQAKVACARLRNSETAGGEVLRKRGKQEIDVLRPPDEVALKLGQNDLLPIKLTQEIDEIPRVKVKAAHEAIVDEQARLCETRAREEP